MTETVKVQRPVFPQGAPWLVYDKDRKFQLTVPDNIVPRHVRKAMGEDHKAYFTATWHDLVGWSLAERVAEEDW